ncbi:MAG: hypothetical protein Fues2KO_09300 [Fuerstiella sp.]
MNDAATSFGDRFSGNFPFGYNDAADFGLGKNALLQFANVTSVLTAVQFRTIVTF